MDSPRMDGIMAVFSEEIDKLFNVAYLTSGYTKEEILSESRIRPLVYVRMTLAKKLWSLIPNVTVIGSILNRAHCTVLYWNRNFADSYEYDNVFKAYYDRFETIYSQQ